MRAGVSGSQDMRHTGFCGEGRNFAPRAARHLPQSPVSRSMRTARNAASWEMGTTHSSREEAHEPASRCHDRGSQSRSHPARLPVVAPHGARQHEAALLRSDPQPPHDQDELYVIASGPGTFFLGGRRVPFEPGNALFAPARVEHRIEDFSDDFETPARSRLARRASARSRPACST